MASLRWLGMIIGMLVIPLVASAAPPDYGFADLWRTVQAVKLLHEDAALAPLHLGVKVRNRVAVLWGPVPSRDLAVRAETRLRNMIELVDVRNELIVMPDERVFTPSPQRPLFSPDKAPPPQEQRRPGLARGGGDDVVAWHAASAKR